MVVVVLFFVAVVTVAMRYTVQLQKVDLSHPQQASLRRFVDVRAEQR
jgi:hypothetical protein